MITIPYITALTTLFGYGLLFAFGQIRDLFRKFVEWSNSKNLQACVWGFISGKINPRTSCCLPDSGICTHLLGSGGLTLAGYIFVFRIAFQGGAPDGWIDVVERYSKDGNKTLIRTKRTSKCLNLGSYNYLGFAAAAEYCTPHAIESLNKFSATTCSTRVDFHA